MRDVRKFVWINGLVMIALVIAISWISIMVTRIIYRPTPAEINHVVEGREKLIHDAKMKFYGKKNTETVIVHYDGSEWFYNEAGKPCRFK
jgi:hypothetical protein